MHAPTFGSPLNCSTCHVRRFHGASNITCITFGAPLVADKHLAAAVVAKAWDTRFLHLVGRHDIVPRVLLEPMPSELIRRPILSSITAYVLSKI